MINGGFINKENKVIIPFKHDTAWGFHDGCSIVELNEKLGAINKTGKIIIPIKYCYATNFENGIALFYPYEPTATNIIPADKLPYYIDINGTQYWED